LLAGVFHKLRFPVQYFEGAVLTVYSSIFASENKLQTRPNIGDRTYLRVEQSQRHATAQTTSSVIVDLMPDDFFWLNSGKASPIPRDLWEKKWIKLVPSRAFPE